MTGNSTINHRIKGSNFAIGTERGNMLKTEENRKDSVSHICFFSNFSMIHLSTKWHNNRNWRGNTKSLRYLEIIAKNHFAKLLWKEFMIFDILLMLTKYDKNEKHLLLVSNQIYYSVYKYTTCHHYTNLIKNGLIKLIKTRKSIYKMWKGLA